MLENQLFLVVGFQYQRVLVEALDASRELHSTHQVDRQDNLVLPGIV